MRKFTLTWRRDNDSDMENCLCLFTQHSDGEWELVGFMHSPRAREGMTDAEKLDADDGWGAWDIEVLSDEGMDTWEELLQDYPRVSLLSIIDWLEENISQSDIDMACERYRSAQRERHG